MQYMFRGTQGMGNKERVEIDCDTKYEMYNPQVRIKSQYDLFILIIFSDPCYV